MYLYLGGSTVIDEKDVIGIFDMEKASVSKDTRDFLRGKDFEVVNVSYDMPSSFLVAKHGDKKMIYISQISTATLKKRNKYTKTQYKFI